MCGRYRLSRRKQIIAEHFDALPSMTTGSHTRPTEVGTLQTLLYRSSRYSAEDCIDLHLPLVKQPFRDVAAIAIVITPAPKLIRGDVLFFGQSKLFNLQLELGYENGNRL